MGASDVLVSICKKESAKASVVSLHAMNKDVRTDFKTALSSGVTEEDATLSSKV